MPGLGSGVWKLLPLCPGFTRDLQALCVQVKGLSVIQDSIKETGGQVMGQCNGEL